jgi:hypothetical protein
MVETILIIVAVVIVLFIVVVAMQPSDFRVERSGSIAAPASAVFPQVNDFHNWTAWSPWEKLDLAMKKTHEGPAAGTGAIYSWNGNKQVGEGRMTILESRPNEYINIKLEFMRPFAATNTAEFAFKNEGKDTKVVWSMTGKRNFMFKAMGLFMSMDKMIGGDFEKGLAQMKAVVEGSTKG